MTNIEDSFDVSNNVVVVTGAAGQLGLSYAEALLARGAAVAAIDINTCSRFSELEDVFGDRFIFLNVDITDRESLLDSSKLVGEVLGTPNVLINNAALDSPPGFNSSGNGPFETYPEDEWDRVMEVNLKGTFLCSQVFGAIMAKAGTGSIINIGSIYGVVSPDQSLYQYRRDRGEDFYKPVAYSASKSGILNLTRYLACYWAKSGVRVNTLTLAGVENSQDDEFLEAYCARIPAGRMATPDDYIGAIVFLASAASTYMTGSNLVVDGGWTAT